MRLLIAIPALNEEASIQQIIERCLRARKEIIENSPVTDVAITVVSDGSTDRTVELAEGFRDEITLIVFPRNRGYGAAIKEAWSRSDAELLGFLDADGTCDPRFFADLVNALQRQSADVALGCRLNAASRMPWLRRVGNVVFASTLTLLSWARVRDTASGMRVVRHTCGAAGAPAPGRTHLARDMRPREKMRPRSHRRDRHAVRGAGRPIEAAARPGRAAVPESDRRRGAALPAGSAPGDGGARLAGAGGGPDAHADRLLPEAPRGAGVDDLSVRGEPFGREPGRAPAVCELPHGTGRGHHAGAGKPWTAPLGVLEPVGVDRTAGAAGGRRPARAAQLSGAGTDRGHVRALVPLRRDVLLLGPGRHHRGDRDHRLRAGPPGNQADVPDG